MEQSPSPSAPAPAPTAGPEGAAARPEERARFERVRARQDEMLGAVDVGLWYCDLPFDELVWDRKVKEHFWLPSDARVTIETFYERIHPDDRERTRAAIERSIAEQAAYDIEYRTVAPAGHAQAGAVRWVRAIGHTAYDDAGGPVRFDGVTVDVTETKRAAERLAASERRYEYAARATSNAIWDWDLATNRVAWNPGVYSVLGYAPGDVEDSADWWYGHLHPDDRERVVRGIHAVIDGADGGHSWSDEYRYRRADGSYAVVVDRGYVARDETGRALRMIGAMEDVTGRREIEERLRLLSEAIPVQVWTAGPEGLLDYVSGRVTDYFGRPAAELVGDGWSQFVHPDDLPRAAARWSESLASGAPYEVQFRLRCHDGTYRWHLSRALPLADAAGRTARWFGSNTDIHDRTLAEEARDLAQAELRATAERLRQATDSGGIGTWEYIPARGAMVWDARTRAIFGVDADAAASAGMFVETLLHPEDRPRFTGAVAAAGDPAGEGTFRAEYRVIRPSDRSMRWVDARGQVFFDGADGPRRATRFVGTVIDITERKQIEESLRDEALLVETLQRIGSTLTAELDLERIVQTVTDEATKLTGAQFGAFFYNVVNARGESFTLYTISGVPREAFSRFPMPRNTHVFDPTFRGTGVVRSDDITRDERYGKNAPYHGMPAGHLPVVSYLAVPVIAHSGEVLGGLFFGHEQRAVFSDRHERLVQGIAGWAAVAMDNARLYGAQQHARAEAERSRQEAEAAQHRAEEANRAKSEFLAAMSHDLRTPLNAIGGYAQLIEDGLYGPVTTRQREAIGRIQRAQQHLLTLINDVLNFARLEAGRVELAPAALELDLLLGEVRGLIEPQVVAKGLRYAQPPTPAGLRVHADHERTVQVLLNLLTNAVKFTDAGGITVAARDGGSHVAVAVSDTGRGIAADKLATIFDPFVQVDRTGADQRAGVGLGLAISRELARAMGGDVAVESAVGVGSTFTVTLPRA